ncbi:MAG: glycosyltransferase family 2 protein [Clostridia bacterium]|nr:glycosyltransferase family 2 protein [Clostridia bacterium]
MKKISIIIPMYNEEEVAKTSYLRIKKVMEALNQYDYEMLLIDDGSSDHTMDLLTQIAKENPKVKVLSFARNFGHQSAVTAGIQYATGDAVIIIDADLQDPPELLPEMIALWEQGNEVIYGQRKARKGESAFKLLTAKMFYRTLNALSDVEIPKDTGDFRLVDRKVIDVVNAMPEHNKFLRGLFSWVGFRQKAYLYERQERYAGKTKYPFKKMWKLASDGIISFSTKPLKIVGGLGILTIILSIGILVYSLISYLFNLNQLTPGWTSIMVAITLFSGVQLLSIWIISEYIARIYDETRNRPEYIIAKKINFE